MEERKNLTSVQLKAPKAAAIAGIVFSVLLIVAFSLLRLSIPLDPLETGAWLDTDTRRITIALNLIPISGIGFLWFIGVLRDRLGQAEDRFFATVFLGSGLLLLAMLFIAAAMAGGIIMAFGSQPARATDVVTFHFARATAYIFMNVYTVKVAGVFMVSTSTIIIYTKITPRWIAFLGYALALLLLFGSLYIEWVFVCFPLWVLLISIYILFENFQHQLHPPIDSV